jgi:hypothetical protein
MKKILIIFFVLCSATGFAQIKFNHFGLGFNYNGTGRVPDGFVKSNFDNSEDFPTTSEYGSLNRTFSAYEFGLKPTKYKSMFFDIDVLQGTEYAYVSDYRSTQMNDTNITQSTNLDITSSLIGVKAMARFTTPTKKRFFYNFGVGVEGLMAYDVDAEGYRSTSKNAWASSFFETTREEFHGEGLSSYSSLNLVQQVGLSYRLGKDESRFPLNQTYLETNFQIINNFTFMNDVVSKYRTYGLTLSLVYEVL